jgi:hypothetical protein
MLGRAMGEIWKTILTVVVTTIVGALLTFAGAFIFNGDIIRALGGITASQLSGGTTYQSGAKCDDHREAIMTIAKNSFCFLMDISVRPTGAIIKEGWDVCRIELESGGHYVLTTEIARSCTRPEDHPEISCKAKCIEF